MFFTNKITGKWNGYTLVNYNFTIKLPVLFQVIRFAQSFLINWDEKMYYEKTGTAAKARTTTLNEELGQYINIYILTKFRYVYN